MSTTKQNPEEEEPFLSIVSNRDANPPIVTNTTKKTKYGAKSAYGIIMIIIGTIMYGVLGIIVRLSMDGADTVPYNSNAVLIVSEFGKFIVTFILLFYLQGISGGITSIKSVPLKEWFLFSIPAILYSITNNLQFYILQYMDPGSLGVLQQTKIIATALLWWYWFKHTIDKQQWIAIILLFIGSLLVAWPDNNNNNKLQMYVIWPMGPILLGIQMCLSVIAGIYTEYVYKTFGTNRSMHIDNLSMYFWGLIANIAQFYYIEYEGINNINLFDGFNNMTYLLIINYITLGLTVAYVMKYFTNIIKLFMSGFAIIVSGILTFIVFELNWTMLYCIGLIVVVFAVILYKSPTKYIK